MEQNMNEEQLQAFWKQSIADAKKHLKACSKNELVRTVIALQIEKYNLVTQLQKLTEASSENVDSANTDDAQS